MAVTANNAIPNVPVSYQTEIGVASASGIVNVGDWLAFSGQAVFATNAGHTAFWKASGAGVALEASPLYDWAGRAIGNSALRYLRQGVIRASAAFSGLSPLGAGVYPSTTGSAVGNPTGGTGQGARWQTGAKLPYSGATGAGGSGVGFIVAASVANAVAGTGEIEIVIPLNRGDFF